MKEPALWSALKTHAETIEPVKGKYRISSCLVYQRRVVCFGKNSYKTHPIMLNNGYREQQIHLHSEADCIQRGLRLLGESKLKYCQIYILRVNKRGEHALAKPCKGCMNLICQYEIPEVYWSV